MIECQILSGRSASGSLQHTRSVSRDMSVEICATNELCNKVVLCVDVMTTLGKIFSVSLHAYPSSVQLDTVTYTGGSVHKSLTEDPAEAQ